MEFQQRQIEHNFMKLYEHVTPLIIFQQKQPSQKNEYEPEVIGQKKGIKIEPTSKKYSCRRSSRRK